MVLSRTSSSSRASAQGIPHNANRLLSNDLRGRVDRSNACEMGVFSVTMERTARADISHVKPYTNQEQ